MLRIGVADLGLLVCAKALGRAVADLRLWIGTVNLDEHGVVHLIGERCLNGVQVRPVAVAGKLGLPVLAHPADIDDLEEVIPRLQRVGRAGIEVYYNAYGATTVQHLASMARKHRLIATGGSDFHGLEHITETPMGGVDIPPEFIERRLAFGKRQTATSSP